MVRAFIALDLSEEIVKQITPIQKTIWKKTLFTGKLIEDQNIHLTLKFLGEISEETVEEVKKRLKEIKIEPFFAEIGEIGVFSKKSPRIIWIKLNGKGVFELQNQIDLKLKAKFPIEARFMSHITIARIKNVKNKKGFLEYLKSIKLKKIRFKVNEFILKKSELESTGPRYTDMEIYNL